MNACCWYDGYEDTYRWKFKNEMPFFFTNTHK